MTKKGDTKVIRIEGHLDEKTQEDVSFAIVQTRKKGAKNIIVDLSKVKYITSSGFSAIIKQWNELKEEGGDLIIVKPPKNIKMIFKVLKLDDDLLLLKTLQAAYEYFDKLANIPDALPTEGSEPEILPASAPSIEEQDTINDT